MFRLSCCSRFALHCKIGFAVADHYKIQFAPCESRTKRNSIRSPSRSSSGGNASGDLKQPGFRIARTDFHRSTSPTCTLFFPCRCSQFWQAVRLNSEAEVKIFQNVIQRSAVSKATERSWRRLLMDRSEPTRSGSVWARRSSCDTSLTCSRLIKSS